jgi:hypothetical protein
MVSKKLFNQTVLIALFFGLFSGTTFAQKTAKPRTIFEYLALSEAAKFTLEADFTTIALNKKSSDYYPGTLMLENGKTFKVEVRSRGKFRRKMAPIPPLKVKFKKKTLAAEGLDTLNEIKLVLPCYNDESGENLIIREYLIYKMFEKVSGVSMRAHLIKINLRDTHVENAKNVRSAILLEDEEDLAVRMNASIVEGFGIPIDSLAANQAALTVMFQYMIGNTDWDIAMQRNVRFVRGKENGKILVVPYDFDFAGLVAAPYASPASESGLRTVRDRFLMAYGLKQPALKRAAQQIKSVKEDLYEICRTRDLSRDDSQAMIDYLQTFFVQLETGDDIPLVLKMPAAE